MLNLPKKLDGLPRLSYYLSDFEPVLSTRAMRVHYHGHHQGYIDAYNKADPTDISKRMFNYAGYIMHNLFWSSITPEKMSYPEDIGKAIVKAGMSVQGSGWVIVDHQLNVSTLPNHGLFLLEETPLFVIDVWEHAYYLDYLNNKKNFLMALLPHINWDVL